MKYLIAPFPSCPRPRYSGGGLGRGLCRAIIIRANPLPSPPPEYRGRENMRSGVRWLLMATACLLLTGCWKENMGSQPKAKPMQASIFFADGTSARPLPLGVISRDATKSDLSIDSGFIDGKLAEKFPAHYPTEDDGPFPTRGPQLRRVLARGRLQFTIFCSMCHGDAGDGRGIIVQRGMVQPPSYHLDRLRQAPVGHFVDVVTNGYGAMYSYGDRISPADRWAIAAYIRTLQMTQAMPADAIKEVSAQ